MGEIGKHPFFCSLMLESGLRKPHFSIDCWFPSRFLSIGNIQERPEGWSWAEGTFSSLFPYFYCLWYITKVPHSGRDGWLQSSPTLSILLCPFSGICSSLCPFSGIGTTWAVVHLRGLCCASWFHYEPPVQGYSVIEVVGMLLGASGKPQ